MSPNIFDRFLARHRIDNRVDRLWRALPAPPRSDITRVGPRGLLSAECKFVSSLTFTGEASRSSGVCLLVVLQVLQASGTAGAAGSSSPYCLLVVLQVLQASGTAGTAG